MTEVIVIGGGVIGLSIARELSKSGIETIVLEKNDRAGDVTSSRNSGVIHAGIYYPEDYLKTKLCIEGNTLIYKYAQEKITPLYPFGHGLSYSKFTYSNLEVKKLNIEDSTINISFTLANQSEYEGEEVVQLYFRDSYSSVTRPIKELIDYRRISMKPNESKQIYFNIPIKKLAFYDINMKYCVEKGNFEFMVGGSSKDNDLIKASLKILDRYNF